MGQIISHRGRFQMTHFRPTANIKSKPRSGLKINFSTTAGLLLCLWRRPKMSHLELSPMTHLVSLCFDFVNNFFNKLVDWESCCFLLTVKSE